MLRVRDSVRVLQAARRESLSHALVGMTRCADAEIVVVIKKPPCVAQLVLGRHISFDPLPTQWGVEAHKTADFSKSLDSFAWKLIILACRIDRRSLPAR